jgi:hypothetical protein
MFRKTLGWQHHMLDARLIHYLLVQTAHFAKPFATNKYVSAFDERRSWTASSGKTGYPGISVIYGVK